MVLVRKAVPVFRQFTCRPSLCIPMGREAKSSKNSGLKIITAYLFKEIRISQKSMILKESDS